MNTSFRTPSGAGLAADVTEVRAGIRHLDVTIELEPSAWRDVNGSELFNSDASVRNGGSISGTTSVSVELRRTDEASLAFVHATALESPDRRRDEFCAALANDPSGPLAQTEEWFLLRASEAVDTPGDLAATGTVRSGFSTSWADADELVASARPQPEVVFGEPEPESAGPLLQSVESYLASMGVGSTREGGNTISASVTGQSGGWQLWIHAIEGERILLAYSMRTAPLDESVRPSAMELAGRLNLRTTLGSFQADPANGGFRYKTSLSLGAASLNDPLLDGLVGPHIPMMDAGLAALDALLGGASVNAAVEELAIPVL